MACKLVVAMKSAGWDVDVIARTRAYDSYPPDSEDSQIWSVVAESIVKAPALAQAEDDNRQKPGRVGSAIQTCLWMWRAARLAARLHRAQRYQCLLSRVAPQYGHFPALRVKQVTGIPWIANWSDPMPPTKAPPPYGRGPHSSAKGMRWFLQVARTADWHTFPSTRLMQYVQTYLPIGTNASVIPHVALRRVTQGCQNREVFTLCHAGDLTGRNPETFLEGVRLFVSSGHSRVQVRVIGGSASAIYGMARKHGVQDIISCIPAMPYLKALQEIAGSAVGIVLEAPMDNGIFLPSKFVDIAQTGRPILAISPPEGTLAEYIGRYGGGLIADNRTPHSIAGAIGLLYQAWLDDTLDTQYGSHRLAAEFAEDRVLASLGDTIDRVVRATGRAI